MSAIAEITIRTISAFALLMLITRLLGKQTISQMTFHDFVSSITLGAIAANLAFNLSMKPWDLAVSLLVFSLIGFTMTLLALKSRASRKWINGQPTVIIDKGKIMENNMKRLKMNLDTLNQELREKDIFNMEEVDYAVLELNGKLSVLKKPEYLPATKKDLDKKQTKTPAAFPIEIIMDGQIVNNSAIPSWDERQIKQELAKRKLTLSQVNYAVVGTNGKLFFDFYDDHKRKS